MRVFKFGALRPAKEHDALLRDLQRKASRYYNALIQVYRHERDRMRAADAKPRDGSGRDACGVGPDDDTRQWWLNSLHEVALAKVAAARAESGLSCGTYWLVEEAVNRAVRDSFPDLPRFQPFRERGDWELIGANIPTNNSAKPVVGLWSNDVTIEMRGLSRGGRRNFAVARLRVQDSKRSGLSHVELPFVADRPLPAGVRIQRASIQIRRVGLRWEYSLIVTCNDSHEYAPGGAGTVAVNLGWRRVEGGVRVALALGSDDQYHALVLPDSLLGRMRHAESLRSLGDSLAVARFGADGAKRRTRERNAVPLTTEGRISAHLRIDLDAATDADAEHWARRDRHLYQWERDEYSGALRARREIYRLWARELAARYGRLLIEDWSLAELALRATGADIPEAKHYRFLVAPSYLRDELRIVFGGRRKRGGGWEGDHLSESMGSYTITCSVCGEESATARKERRRKLILECERCGARWDQDLGNARNQHATQAAE